ncbi:MAG: sigma 54-interacting transcriptional regulator, partial [Ferrimonas sp.]
NLLDSELIGHESGAFTGAGKRHEGRFERAHKGTLFLDELANASVTVQEKLLRVIEYGQYERVGGRQALSADVRLICATNEDLPYLAQQGRFRADLLDRLAFDVITLPPLRARQQDILPLANHFAMKMSRQLGLSQFVGFHDFAQQALEQYAWPGNVRELKNAVERSVYRHADHMGPITAIIFDPFASPWRLAHLPASETKAPNINGSPTSADHLDSPPEPSNPKQVSTVPTTDASVISHWPIDFKADCQRHERQLLQQALTHSQYNQKQCAQQLGLTYHQLRGLLKKHQMLASAIEPNSPPC